MSIGSVWSGGEYFNSVLPSWSDVQDKVKKYTFALASYATDPVCSFDADKMYLQNRVFTQLFPCDGSLVSKISNWVRKSVIAADMVVNLALAPVGFFGIFLRYAGVNLSQEPFIYETTDTPPKSFPLDGKFTLHNWNILCIPGENSILHGGASNVDSGYRPASEGKPAQGFPFLGFEWVARFFVPKEECTTRLDRLIEEIKQGDADVVCLYEGFDFGVVERIKSAVKGQFHCMISNIAPGHLGVNSGVVILSKFHIPRSSVLVEQFPKQFKGDNGEVVKVKNGEYVNKSLVKFSIEGKTIQEVAKAVADIYPLHLSHSEQVNPIKVTLEEKTVRRGQLDRVFAEMHKSAIDGRAVIGCGDWNLDPSELEQHPHIKDKSIAFVGNIGKGVTWGGDIASARLEGIEPSGPIQLDYAVAVEGTVSSIDTEVVNVGDFESSVIQWGYCSDHYLLKSAVQLKGFLKVQAKQK